MVDINTKEKTISLTTHSRPLQGREKISSEVAPEAEFQNKCELDWGTGKYYVFCGNDKYEMPFGTHKIELDKD